MQTGKYLRQWFSNKYTTRKPQNDFDVPKDIDFLYPEHIANANDVLSSLFSDQTLPSYGVIIKNAMNDHKLFVMCVGSDAPQLHVKNTSRVQSLISFISGSVVWEIKDDCANIKLNDPNWFFMCGSAHKGLTFCQSCSKTTVFRDKIAKDCKSTEWPHNDTG